MAAANERLKELNPSLRITREASDRYKYYMAHRPESDSAVKVIRPRMEELRRKVCDPDRLVRSIFANTRSLGAKERLKFMTELYCMASVMQGVEYLDCSLYDLFTQDELYTLYELRSWQMYLEVGPSAEFGDGAMRDAIPLLRNFMEEADEAIATGRLSASLRYGHDVYVIPLVALMTVEGCCGRVSDFEKADAAWSCWRVSPMATNIQWVFYRRPGGGEVLVKFLFNEREVRIGLESDLEPYYRWTDVKNYFEKRISDLSK